ncbi:MAG: helix-turn-helix transcriptional regulator, partial [Paenibacillus macerans]|nr:helix-turn-helix transcriptional regulator [Paenibacillus macerans]
MTTIQKLDIIEILEILIGVVVSMDSATTITTRLNDYMKQEGLSLSQFAQKIGLNIGTLSYILNGNRTLSIEQLDLITECMGLAKGYFYNQYFEEVLVESTPNWRRIKPFIYGCAEIGNWDLIHKAVQLLLDTLVYSSHLFDVAEDFYKSGKKEAAIILYENVALSERNQ